MKTLLLLSLTGCAIVPSTKTTRTDLGREVETVKVADHGVALSSEETHGSILVRARHSFDCERRTLAISRTLKTTGARVGGTKDPRGRVFGALLAPITIPISAAITGLVVASSRAEAKRESAIVGAERYPCVDVEPAAAVLVELPSGATRELRTDAIGEATFEVPDAEPFTGNAIVHVGRATASIAYARKMPAVTAVREATRVCAAKHSVGGALELTITVGSDGKPSRVGTDLDDAAFAGCVTAAIAKVEFPPAQRDRSIVLPFRLHASLTPAPTQPHAPR